MRWKALFLGVFYSASLFLNANGTSSESNKEPTCFFSPPKGWELSDPKNLSSRVKIAFLKNTGHGFCPSINLAIEKTSASQNDYLKAVKAIHEQDRENHWRALGKVHTEAGLAQLTQIDTASQWGPVRMLQLFFVKNGYAYILTAAALKEEFSNYYKEIQSSFRSLTLTSDLLDNIPQLERREMLKQKQQQLTTLEKTADQEKQWLTFQQTVLDGFKDMGAFWQVLVLKDTQEKMTQKGDLQ